MTQSAPEFTENYIRRPFAVKAVQISEENIRDLAEWTEGSVGVNHKNETNIRIIEPPGKRLRYRQKHGFYGDWLVHGPQGFRIFSNEAFHRTFEAK